MQEKGLYVDTKHISLNKKDASSQLSKLTQDKIKEFASFCPPEINLMHPTLKESLEFSEQEFKSGNRTLLDKLEKELNKK